MKLRFCPSIILLYTVASVEQHLRPHASGGTPAILKNEGMPEALTGKHPIRPTSPRCRRSRRLEPGRRSTYPLKILFRQMEPPQPSVQPHRAKYSLSRFRLLNQEATL